MRISVFPKGHLRELIVLHTMDVFDWIRLAGGLPPVEGLELHADFFTATDDAFVDRVGEALQGGGFEMPMLCVSPDLSHPDRAVRDREFERQLMLIDIAARLGPPDVTCRVLSGQRHPGVRMEDGLDWVADAIQRLLPHARRAGVTLALENHYKASGWQYPEFAQQREHFLDLLSRIDERVYFGVQFDPSNAITAGLDSAEFLGEVVDRVVSMQASDRFLAPGATLDALRLADGTIGYSPALQHGVVGQGLNDYPRIFEILVAAGYDGWISIEDGVNGMQELADSVTYLRKARETWFGGSMAVRVRSREQAQQLGAAAKA